MKGRKEYRTPIKVIKMLDITNSINLTVRNQIPDLVSRKTVESLSKVYDRFDTQHDATDILCSTVGYMHQCLAIEA